MTRVKICGLQTPADIDAVNRLRPDFVGFVFAPQSRRRVTPQTAAALRARLADGIEAVGVFVDAPPELPAKLAADGVIDRIQLHGHEDAAYIAALRRQTACPLLQAFCITSPADVSTAFATAADFPLLDNGAGGTGASFDWTLLAETCRPFFLAGGLDAENVGEAVRRYHPYAVDVSSGVETNGHKDADKIERFLAAVRRAG